MRKVSWYIGTGFVNAKYEGVFEVDDDCSEDEIHEMVMDEVWNRIEVSWNVESVND
jgi:hypothetical protein